VRLGLVIYGSLDTRSGGYLYDRKLVDYLRRQGDHVEIVSLPWRSYPRHLGDNFSKALLDRLSRLQVDILLQDELNHPSLFRLNRRLRSRTSSPIISIVHHLRCSEQHPAWLKPFYRAVERAYLHSVDGFIFNSRTTRTVVEQLLGRETAGVVAWPAGNRLDVRLSPEEIIRRAHRPGPLQIIFVGNVIPRKGLHTLLAALARLPTESWRLTVVGSLTVAPAYVRQIRRRIAGQGLESQMDFGGSVPDETLAAQLQTAHVLALPSSYEGFGIVYLEGMGAGLPAIATTAGAAGEIITHAETGFLIGPGDTATLANYLHEMHQNRERLAAMSLAAQHRYAAQPTWEQTTQRIREYLCQFQTTTASPATWRPKKV